MRLFVAEHLEIRFILFFRKRGGEGGCNLYSIYCYEQDALGLNGVECSLFNGYMYCLLVEIVEQFGSEVLILMQTSKSSLDGILSVVNIYTVGVYTKFTI